MALPRPRERAFPPRPRQTARTAALGGGAPHRHTRPVAGRTGLRWLLRRDPGLGATRRAMRVAVVATGAFTLCRYGLGSPTSATYAAFGAIGFGVLSQVVGRRHEEDIDWFTVLGVVHRTMRTVRSALDDPDGPATATPWPDLVARLDHDARALAEGYATVARALAEGRTPAAVLTVPADFVDRALRAVADAPDRRGHPRETLRLVDAWGRLGWSADDLAALGVVLSPAAAGRRPQPA